MSQAKSRDNSGSLSTFENFLEFFKVIYRFTRLNRKLLPFYADEIFPKYQKRRGFSLGADFSRTTLLSKTFLFSLIVGSIFLLRQNGYFNRSEETVNAYSWFYDLEALAEEPICDKDDPSPLVVISFDGFAAEYLQRGIVKNLELIGKRGVRAEHVKPTFPSKTLPNHYTMVTGLYPGYHGIVENWIYDPSISPDFVDVRKTSRYEYYKYGGEPIWATYRRQTGRRVSCLFYPGCYHYPENRPDVTEIFENVPVEKVLNRVAEEILKPRAIRPGLVIGYSNEPDETRHLVQSDSPKLTAILERIDQAIGDFFNVLHKAKRLQCTNIIFISDHGFMNQNQVLNATQLEIPSKYANADTVARFYLKDGAPESGEILKKLGSDPERTSFLAYNRSTLPPRFHYTVSKRVGDIVVTAAREKRFGLYPYPAKPRIIVASNHGWDYIMPEMEMIFFAMGPDFLRGHVLAPFQNTEYYNLFAEILKIKPEPNNGTQGILSTALKNRDEAVDPIYENMKTIHPCSGEASSVMINFLKQESGLDYCYQKPDDKSYHLEAPGRKSVVEILTKNDLKFYPENMDFIRKLFPSEISLAAGPVQNAVNSLKITVSPEFRDSLWRAVERKTAEYLQKYDTLLGISGWIEKPHDHIQAYFYRILVRCEDGNWDLDNRHCQNSHATKALAFLLPYPFENFNMMDSEQLLLEYTARIKDLEVVSGLRFFTNTEKFAYFDAIQLKTEIITRLW